jgi:DNA polymerase-3 subunit delta'
MDFNSLVGQENVKRILTRTADRNQLPNSYLFAGPEGTGKWAAALAMAAYLNCQSQSDSDSCGDCPSCHQISKLQFPNLHIAIPTPPSKTEKEELANYWEILNQKIDEPYSLIGGERQMSIPVATVRSMKQNLAQKAPPSGRRVVIIEQMDRMLTSSADALLKLIEEPPSRTLIIITSARPEKLLPTIISRCRKVRFAHLPENEIKKYLSDKTELSDNAAVLLARLSQGSLGRALYLTDTDIQQDREVAKLIFKGMFVSDSANLIAEAADLLPFNNRFRLNRIIAVWQSLFRDLILLRSGEQKNLLINIDFAVELEKISGRDLSDDSLARIPAYLGTITADIDLNVDTKSALAATLIETQTRLGV